MISLTLISNSTAPAVNVKETDKSYVMELAAPGIKKEYCRVAINDEGNLTIAIENKAEHKHEDKHHHYLRREFSYSNYEQNYALPDDVVKDQISAKVEDGILTITMPKTEPKEKVMRIRLVKTAAGSIHDGCCLFLLCICRDYWTRTSDLAPPRRVRYQLR